MAKITHVRLEQITQAKKLLRDLPVKEGMKTREETVTLLAKEFQSVAQKGYSPQEISAVLKQLELHIPATHIKKSLRLNEQKKRKITEEKNAEKKSQSCSKPEIKNTVSVTENDSFLVPDTPLDEL